MNKSKMLLLAILFFGINSLQAGRKAIKSIPVPEAAGEADTIQPTPQSLEEQHKVIPINKRQEITQQALCKNIRHTVAQELHNLAANSNNNLMISEPTTAQAPRLIVYTHPETNTARYIHYTPSKPVIMINGKEEYIHKTHELFQELANKYASCGLMLETTPGRAPANWLAYYETEMGKMGSSPKVYLILKDKKPTLEQIKMYEQAGM